MVLISESCRQDQIPKQVLELTDNRYRLYEEQKLAECKSKAIEKAELAVDSFFLSIRKQYLLDSIQVPAKPSKPFVDTSLHLDQTAPVKPLWDTFHLHK